MHNTRVLGNNQLFVIELLDIAKLELRRTAAKVIGWEKARPLLGPLTKVLIRWVGDKTIAKPAHIESRRRLMAYDQPPASLAVTLGLQDSNARDKDVLPAVEATEEVGLIGVEEDFFGSRKTLGAATTTAKLWESPRGAFSFSPNDECVTVRRIRSRSFVGQFETQLVLRPCPSDATVRASFGKRSGVHSFNNLSTEALLTASSNLDHQVGVTDPFPPGSAPHGPKNGQTGLIERVGGVQSTGGGKRRHLLSREDVLTRPRGGKKRSSTTNGNRAVVFDHVYYTSKQEDFKQGSRPAQDGEIESQAEFRRADSEERKKDSIGDFVFTLERTRSFGTPYAPGITKGRVPSWFTND